jgi:arabinose-5-phosphate isomerase
MLQEADAVVSCANSLGVEFSSAVEWILGCTGRVICCGIGKSGHIANKTAATLASTGTPSFFLHAAEAVHGDLGMVTERDIVLLYTHSGETDELVRLFPSFKSSGARTILVTGRPGSTAARLSDLILDTGVKEEACPNNLAPTTSTTVMLALSDALAIAVMESRGFGKEDFAKYHPAGALGKRLLLTVESVMRSLADTAVSSATDPVLVVMKAIATAGVGASCVLNQQQELLGFVTEGDLRRHLLKTPINIDATAEEFMTRNPGTIEPDLLAIEALEVFQNYPIKIGELPVVKDGKVVGLLMLKDLMRSGIV